MFVVAQHQISNPKKFWESVKNAQLPSEVKLHYTLPNSEGTKAVCLWEANEISKIKNVVEGAVGQFSKNEYFSVEAKNAMGLPK